MTRNKGEKILLNVDERIPKKLISKVESIVKKSDKLKRENCILQGSGLFYVIKPGELSIFKERSENNIRTGIQRLTQHNYLQSVWYSSSRRNNNQGYMLV